MNGQNMREPGQPATTQQRGKQEEKQLRQATGRGSTQQAGKTKKRKGWERGEEAHRNLTLAGRRANSTKQNRQQRKNTAARHLKQGSMRKEHIHTQTHTQTHTNTHKHTNTQTHTNTHTNTQTHKHTHIPEDEDAGCGMGRERVFWGKRGKKRGREEDGKASVPSYACCIHGPTRGKVHPAIPMYPGSHQRTGGAGLCQVAIISFEFVCVCGCIFFKRATERTGCILPMFLQNCFSARGTIMGKKTLRFFPRFCVLLSGFLFN